MVTLRDVARLARVSTTTVSSVVNQKGKVSEKLAGRVREAVDKLDYYPHHGARSLKMRRTGILGLLIPDSTNFFFIQVMRGISAEARRNGYSVMLCDASEDPNLERQYLATLFQHRVDGVLLAPASEHGVVDFLPRRHFPVVLIDRIPFGFHDSSVTTDSYGASRDGVRHLIGLGHKRIAVITGRPDLSNSVNRLEGFRRALEEARIATPTEYIRCGNYSLEGGYQCGLELMQLPKPPTAIFSCNNLMTLGLMRALGELKIPCPKRVSVLGFDEFIWTDYFSPRLTTIAQPTFEIGRKAVQLLMQKIQAGMQDLEGSEGQSIILQNELRIRESTAPPHMRKAS